MNIALLGYGKMGKTIESLAKTKNANIVYKHTKTQSEGDLSKADVAIEFSSPESALAHISMCFKAGIPVVCGSTGWLSQWENMLSLQKKYRGSIVYAANFSIGVNLFLKLAKTCAILMEEFPEYMPSLEEIHHTQKLDAPSGTAIALAEKILPHTSFSKWQLLTDNNAFNSDALNINAYRQGDVKGTHTLLYKSKADSLSLKHEAHTRDGFALGALIAAQWVLGKQGVFSMEDVLKTP